MGSIPKSRLVTKKKAEPFSFNMMKMRKQKNIQKILKRIKADDYEIDKSIIDEIKKYTSASVPPSIASSTSTKAGMESLNESILRTQAYKDRVTTILVPLLKIKSKLKRRREEAVAFLWQSYYPVLSQLKTESARGAVINQILSPLVAKLENARLLVDSCETVRDNLVSTSFALKEVAMLANTSMQLTKTNI